MEFKFRDRVKVKEFQSSILRPDGVATQAGFFQGSEGIVIRHDPAKGGYLVVLDCPEVQAAMGETITAYFNEYELEPAPPLVIPDPQYFVNRDVMTPYNPTPFTAEGLTPYQATKAKANRAKRLGDV